MIKTEPFAVLFSVLVLCMGCGTTNAHDTESAGQSLPYPVRDPRLALGIDLPIGYWDMAPYDDVEKMLGRKIDSIQAFIGWAYVGGEPWNEFPTAHALDVVERGATLEITWGPAVNGGDFEQPDFRFAAIINGTHDDYIRRFALAARKLESRIVIRLAHEMNGDWSLWSEQRNGNKPGEFVKMWRHVYDIFNEVGADNVKWLWSPNVTLPGTPSLRALYPGDQYVDIVGVDGYAYPQEGCRTPREVFDPAVQDIRAFTRRPLVLAEVAVAEQCEDKGRWITQFFEWLDERPYVRGLTWWNRQEAGRDWRISSSPEAQTAFVTGLDRLYGSAATPTPPVVDVTEACGDVTSAGFTDVPVDHPLAREIYCLRSWGITKGSGSGRRYDPRKLLSRWQMAVFIDRLSRLERDVGEAPRHGDGGAFDDVSALSQEARYAIARMRELGVIEGRSKVMFVPFDHVTRAQTAAFLSRLREVGSDVSTAEAADYFTDDDATVHERDINAVAEAGIIRGVGRRRYEPGVSVTRGQMAAMLTRYIQVRLDAGHLGVNAGN